MLIFFSLIIHSYFLVPTVIIQFFNTIAELVIHIEIPTKEAKEEMEIYAGTREI